MCNPVAMMATSAAVSAVGARGQAKAQQAGLNYQASVSDQNATLADMQARDAIRQGQGQEQNLRLQTGQLKGSQRATMAANGIDLTDTGSANDVFTSTDYMADHDAATIQNNALRQAWGYNVQAENYRNDASAKRAGASAISPNMAMATSLLTSAGSVAGSWDKFSPASASSSLSTSYNGDGLKLGKSTSGFRW